MNPFSTERTIATLNAFLLPMLHHPSINSASSHQRLDIITLGTVCLIVASSRSLDIKLAQFLRPLHFYVSIESVELKPLMDRQIMSITGNEG